MATINLGNGNVTAIENSSNDTISAGNGTDDLTVIGNSDTLRIGNGNDMVILTSSPLFNTGLINKLVAGNGHNLVNASDTNPSLNFNLTADGDSDGAGGTGINAVASNDASQAATTAATDFYGTPTTVTMTINYDGSLLPNSIMGQNYSWAAANMTLGDGSNVVYGTIKTLELQALNGAVIDGNTFTFGSLKNDSLIGNTITVGNGANNQIYGTMDTLSLFAQGVLYIPDPITLYYESQFLNPNFIIPDDVLLLNDPGSLITGETISYGSNMITVGNGSGNHIYGTLDNFEITAGQEDIPLLAVETSPGPSYAFWTDIGGIGLDGGQSGNTYTFGGNTIIVGNGASDHLFGTLGILTITSPGIGFIGAYGGGYNNFFFGGNILKAGNGNGDLLFGTMQEFNLPNVGLGGFDDGTNLFVFNSNNLLVGSGNNDQLYGSLQEISFTDSFVGADDPGLNTFIFGTKVGNIIVGNTLTAGNGNGDMLFGTMQDFVSDNSQLNADGGSTPTVPSGNIFSFGDNTLQAGNGNNDVLYGTMSDLLISIDDGIVGGVPDFDDTLPCGGNSFSFGSNKLSAGNGIGDQLYGTIKEFNLSATDFGLIGGAGGIIDSVFSNGYFEPGGYNTFSFGNNQLTADNGFNDQLFGTMEDFTLSASGPSLIGGQAGGDNTFTFGNNTLVAGNGNTDMLYGALQTMTFTASSDAATTSVIGGASQQGFISGGENILTFGNDTLTVGNGIGDVLYGTMQDLSLNAPMNAVIGGYFGDIGAISPSENSFDFGKNGLTVGNGADILFGTLETINLAAVGPGDTLLTAFAPPFVTTADETANQIAQADGVSSAIGGISGGDNSFTFGDNTLTAGNGNDTLYGDMQDLGMEVSGLLNVIGGIGDGFNSFNFGKNTLTAGNGNDVLFGTLDDITLSATNSSFIGNGGGGGNNFNSIIFGNNIITAGNGNDTLYANMHDLILELDNTVGNNGIISNIDGNIIQFGTSVINAGNGNDTLVGELYHIDLPTQILNPLYDPSDPSNVPQYLTNVETIAAFLNQNIINPGQTTFNLGNGTDTLVFDVGIDMGKNIVNNFNAAKDILEFTNASGSNLSNVQSDVKSIASDGNGGTLVTFYAAQGDSVHGNGGTIDFTNIHYTGQTQLSDLVNHQAAHIVVIV